MAEPTIGVGLTDDGDLNEERAKRNRAELDGTNAEPDVKKVASDYAKHKAAFKEIGA